MYKFSVGSGEKQIAYVLEDGDVHKTIFLDPKGRLDEIRAQGTKDFFPCFETGSEHNTRIYISGKTGSGKTTFANRAVKEIKNRHPRKKIYLVSPYEEDKSMDKDIGPEITRLPPGNHDVAEFPDSIIIFDDIDSFKDDKIKKETYSFCNAALQSGRHHRVDVIFINHTLKNHQWTKYVIQECNYYVMFPGAGNEAQIGAFCKDYCGLTTKAVKQIKRTYNSRWVVVCAQYPTFIITQRHIYFPSKE